MESFSSQLLVPLYLRIMTDGALLELDLLILSNTSPGQVTPKPCQYAVLRDYPLQSDIPLWLCNWYFFLIWTDELALRDIHCQCVWKVIILDLWSETKNISAVTVVYTVLGPMVRHYALGYGFHTFPNLLIKPLREAHGFVLYTNSPGICIQNENAGALARPPATCPPCQYSRLKELLTLILWCDVTVITCVTWCHNRDVQIGSILTPCFVRRTIVTSRRDVTRRHVNITSRQYVGKVQDWNDLFYRFCVLYYFWSGPGRK